MNFDKSVGGVEQIASQALEEADPFSRVAEGALVPDADPEGQTSGSDSVRDEDADGYDYYDDYDDYPENPGHANLRVVDSR
jgi:hypothetical protein